MNKERVTLSQKELQRLVVLEKLRDGSVSPVR